MIFDAEPDYVASLDSLSLVHLLRRLALAESRLMGIPLRGVSVPLQITIADGGEDGRVEWSGGNASTPYLSSRYCVFQSKAQKLSEAQVKREVLKVLPKGTPKLNSAIVDVLNQKGAYVIFCSERMVKDKRDKLCKAIRAAITAGGKDPTTISIDVYDANIIADWVNTHPPVALWLASQRLGRNLAGFQTHEGWGRNPEFDPPWQPTDDPRFAPTNRVIPVEERIAPSRNAWTYEQACFHVLEMLANEKSIVRISGPSGFGKSRFAYELFKRNCDIADFIDAASVIYCDGSISVEEAIKLAIELSDSQLSTILVVDECSDAHHLKLASIVRRTNSRLRLVTMDIETKVLEATGTLSLRLEKADERLIKSIANGIAPELSDGDQSFIADLADGFPRMAVLAAQQQADGRQTFLSVEQIIERIVWSGKPRIVEAQRALEIASLFEWFGLQGRVEDQASFLAIELAQMPLNVFIEYLLSFKSRGIVTQRGDFVQIGPVPLAARLGLARLGVMTPEQLLSIFQRAPRELQGLLKRMRWLDTSPVAATFAEHLLRPEHLGNFAAVNTDGGSQLLDRLVHIAPDLVSATIDRIFGGLTVDELRAGRDGRHNLVRSLEKLVFRKQTFDRSARMLLKLATAENESYSNNATGLFKQLFQLYLSGTEAEPEQRLLVLDDGLKSKDPVTRAICVEALGHMLDNGHFSRGGGAERIGSADALEDWRPATYGQIRDFFRSALSRLVAVATSGGEGAGIAKNHLGSHVRGLLNQLPAEEVKEMIDTIMAHHGFWPEALTGISDWLYFDRSKDVPSDVAEGIRRMYDELLPTDLVDLAVLYTHGWSVSLHDPDSTYSHGLAGTHDFDFAARKAAAIAKEISHDIGLINRSIERLACSDAHGAAPFARELIKTVADPETLFAKAIQVAEAHDSPPNRGFFGALVSGANERDPELAATLIRSALKSQRLRGEAIALIGSSGLRSDDIGLVVSLLRSGEIKPWQCQHLGLFRAPAADLLTVLDELEKHGNDGLWSILDIVTMYLHGGHNTATPELITLLKRVLIAPALMESVRNNMDGHHFQELVGRLAKLGAFDQSFAKKLAKQCLRICRPVSANVFYDLDDPVRNVLGQLMAVHPKAIWAEITRKLDNESPDRHYVEMLLAARHQEDHLARGLAFEVPPTIYLEWVREDPSARASIAVTWLPIAERDESGQLGWHFELDAFVSEFGDHDGVLSGISGRLLPMAYWGGIAPHIDAIIPLVESWASHPKLEVRLWVAAQLDWLHKARSEDLKRREEDVVRYS